MLAATVRIEGDWNGTVVFCGSEHLVQRAAISMFGLAPEDVRESDMQDMVRELTNMTGGSIKALFRRQQPPDSARGS